MENALDSSRGTFISKVDFVLSVRAEYGINDPGIETCLERFFHSFDCERARSHDILCTYMTIVYSKLVEENPRKLILNLCKMCSTKHSIHIDNVQRIVDLGRCGSNCNRVTSSVLINDLARLCLEKYDENRIDTNVVCEILDLHPQLVIQFGENVRARLPSSVRMKILISNQASAESTALICSQKVAVRRTIRIWRQLLIKTFKAWMLITKDTRDKRVLEYRMKYWKARRLLLTWSNNYSQLLRYHELKAVAMKYSSHNKQKRYFKSWRRLAHVKSLYCWQPRRLRNIALGCSLFKTLYSKILAKTMISTWHSEVELYNRIVQARQWNKKYCVRVHLAFWKQSIESCKLQLFQNEYRRLVTATLQKMKTGSNTHNSHMYIHPDRMERSSIGTRQESTELKSRARQRRTELILEANHLILKEQREKENVEYARLWKLKWNNEENRRIDIVKNHTQKWFSSQEGREKLTTFVKAMDRELQFPSILSTSTSTMVLGQLDAKLGHRGLLSDALFENLSVITKDSKVTVPEFHEYLEKRGCGLSYNSIREIFDQVGGTKITVRDLHKLLRESRTWTGTEGCQWKRFIDPKSEIIVYHNVVEDKQVPEYKLKGKIKTKIAMDHFLSTNIIEERRKVWGERNVDKTASSRNRAATTILRFWKGQKIIERRHRRIGVRAKLRSS